MLGLVLWFGLIVLLNIVEIIIVWGPKFKTPLPTHDEVAKQAIESLELLKSYGNDSVKFLCDREIKKFQEISTRK